MRRMSELFEGFNVNQAMMMAAAGSHKPGGLAGRVQDMEQAYANLAAADPKQGKAGKKFIDALEIAVQKAEAFFKENMAPVVRLLHTDSMGNKDTIVVTGTSVFAFGGDGTKGTPMSLENYTFMMRGENNSKVFRDALLAAYRKSGGDAHTVAKVAADVSKLPGQWSVKK